MQILPLTMLTQFDLIFEPRFNGGSLPEYGFEVAPHDGLPVKLIRKK